MKGHILVDLDGTLAHYDEWKGEAHIGEPIQPMVDRVKKWLAEGQEVRIFTARISPIVDLMLKGNVDILMLDKLKARIGDPILEWCVTHLGCPLPITCIKDFGAIELWDDRAVEVSINTGIPVNVARR